MKITSAIAFVVCFLFQNALAQQPTIDFLLSWDGKSSFIDIDLSYCPSTKDSTVFQFGFPGFGGQADIFSVVEDLRASRKEEIKIDRENGRIVVFHYREGAHTLHYRVNGKVNADNGKQAIYRELFRPVITDGDLYLTPGSFMFFSQENRATHISFRFETPEKGTPYFLSYNPEAHIGNTISIPVNKAGEILIAGGKAVGIKKYIVQLNPYYFITSGIDTLNKMEDEAKQFFTDYYPSLRRFWGDSAKDALYIYLSRLYSTALPVRGGFAWGKGIIMKFQGEFDLDKRYVLAHEISHLWLRKVELGSSFDHQWFGEGFNDYLSLTNMVNAGLMPDTAFIRLLNNDFFKPHYTSNIKSIPNDSIAAKYWSDKNYEKLPYRRGCIYAFYLDNKLRIASAGKITLRNVLAGLLQRKKDYEDTGAGKGLQIEDFIDIVSGFLPHNNMDQDIRAHMLEGKLVDFSTVSLSPEFSMSIVDDIPELSIRTGMNLSAFYRW